MEKAFARIGQGIEWRGDGLEEVGVETGTDRVLVEIDPRYFRPTEVEQLLGDSAKARQKLGWQHRVSFQALVDEMVDKDLADLRLAQSPRGRD